MTADKSQPLFPSVLQQGDTNLIFKGLSIFDFYAAQAPRVPAWFEHAPPPNAPIHPGFFKNHFGTESEYKHKSIVLAHYYDDEWVGDYESTVSPEVKAEIDCDIAKWQAKIDKYLVDEPAWKLHNNMERIAQWAKAYATHMVSMREERPHNKLWDLKPEELDRLIKVMDTSSNEIYSFPLTVFTEEDIIYAFNQGFYLGTDTDVYGEFITQRDELVTSLKKAHEPKNITTPGAE